MEFNRPKSRTGILVLSFTACLMILGILLLSFVKHFKERKEANTLNQIEKKGQFVNIAQVEKAQSTREKLLIGETRAYYSVSLFARVSGYLTELHVDIGDTVKKDQPLAHVESPEAEQAYNSAYADAINRRRIAKRMRQLLSRKLISPQEAEQAITAADIAEANLRTQAVIRAYQNIIAPFEGRITQRLVDPGALIQNASGSQSSSQPLFILSQTNRLRIFTYIDQKDASFTHIGDPVEISVVGHPEFKINSKIERLAGELDPKTRTLLAEIVVNNSDQKIIPGSFVQVKLQIQMPAYLSLPSSALTFIGKDSFVPVIQNDQRIHYTKINLVENTGTQILIQSGVEEGQRVALHIGSSMKEGQPVQQVQQAGQVQVH